MKSFRLAILCLASGISGNAEGRTNDRVDQYIKALIQGDSTSKKTMTSLIESHLNDQHMHALVSGDSAKQRVQDMDCDKVIDDIDVIENTCHGQRWNVLRDISQTFEQMHHNYSELNLTLVGINRTMRGNEWGEDGLFGLIELQKAMIYGENLKNGTSVQQFSGFLKSINVMRKNAGTIFNASVGVMDTEWTNLLTVVNRLGMFFRDFHIGQFTSQLTVGSAEAESTQKQMMAEINAEKETVVDTANRFLTNISNTVNTFETGFAARVNGFQEQKDSLIASQDNQMDRASSKLADLEDYIQTTVPSKLASSVDKFQSSARSILKKASSDFFAASKDKNKQIASNWGKQTSLFSSNSQDLISREKSDWENAKQQSLADLNQKMSTLSKQSQTAAANFRMADSSNLVTMNDITTSLSDSMDSVIFSSEDTMRGVSKQVGDTKGKVESLNQMTVKAATSLLQQLMDGTGNQQQKISSFLKIASDSNASQLAALIQSASSMRDSLGEGQKDSENQLDALIANLQSRLAQKTQDEGSVSADVQKALQVGKSSSDAKIQALSDYQDSLNGQSAGSIQDAAAAVLDWLTSSSIRGSDMGISINSDLKTASSAATAFLNDGVSSQEASAANAAKALLAMSHSQSGASSRALSDASSATDGILAAIQAARDGGSSLKDGIMSRSSSMQDKLSQYANQLGSGDDSVAGLFSSIFSSVSGDAKSQIQALLYNRLHASQTSGSQTGVQVSSLGGDIDSLTDSTESSDQQALDITGNFRTKFQSISNGLDTKMSFRDRAQTSTKETLNDSLEQTLNELGAKAKKSLTASTTSQQSLADEGSVQVDKEIQRFMREADLKAKSDLEAISNAEVTISGLQRADMAGRELDLEKAIDKFADLYQDAVSKLALARSQENDTNSWFANNASMIMNQLNSSSLVDLSPLDNAQAALTDFIKNTPRRISDQMRIIEESFVSTEKQLASKASMLKSMASGNLTDSQKKALSYEMKNLDKSQELMNDFKDVQRQALNAVFSKETGLLGNTSGTVGNLQTIADSISAMVNGNQQVNDLVNQAISKSRVDTESLISGMQGALEGTNHTLQNQLQSVNQQTSFSNNISNAQISALISSSKSDAIEAQKAAADVDESSDAAVQEKQAILAALTKVLQDNQAALDAQSAATLEASNSSYADLNANITESAADRDIQLTIVKNLVQQLLQTWQDYTESQGRKFDRWNRTEDQYVGQFLGTLASLNQSARTEASKTGKAILDIKGSTEIAISNFVTMENGLQTLLNQVHDAVQSLNVSTENSASQVGEQIYAVDASDKSLDDQARSSALQQANQTEIDVDNQGQGVLKTFDIDPVAGFIEIQALPGDDVLRAEISELDQAIRTRIK